MQKLILIAFYAIATLCLSTSCMKDHFETNSMNLSDDPLESRSAGACDGLIEKNITACGLSRYYYIDLPVEYDPDSTYPLLFAFHGKGSGFKNKACVWSERIGAWIDENRYIAVYPRAYNDSYWYVGSEMDADPVPDLCFVQKIKNQMESHYRIDTNKIYAMGTSNGGGLCYAIAANVSWLAAIAPVAAYQWEGYDLAEPPVLPVFQIHGTVDYTIPYYGGSGPFGLEFSGAFHADSTWAKDNNDCPAPYLINETIITGTPISRYSWCPVICGGGGMCINKRKTVVHLKLEGIGHTVYDLITPEVKEYMNDQIFNFLIHHPK